MARWSLAQAGLKAAHGARYTVVGSVDVGGNRVTYTRHFTVDADAHRLAVRATLRGNARAGDLDLVVTPQGAFARISGGSGSWRRASDVDLARAGVGRAAEEISALPVPLTTFVAASDVGFGEISGNVDAKEGLRALGLGTLVADGQELSTELSGELYTTVSLDGAGNVEKARITGRDSTGWGMTTVYGGSKELPEQQLQALFSLIDVSITIQSVDRPVAITVPRPSEIRG
ncbi:hypothetical protein [Intrasporangium flavum]|uniref:hypothetical protein n=1 Tax=Intrasporangium flavum TaxID=1428657 RepID=UPI001A95E599|nr:hypothetical protein [Intrasporangium flavum]